jgi:glycosyltransferase involved in cell wall biosynthesis
VTEDLVTVVIPTRNRPQLVGRAVTSALAQTQASLEVVVVIDGPDEATRAALARLPDPRLRVVALPASVGAQEARNAGVREARGRWVAFLDDDDEWRPQKLARQVAAGRASRFPHPLVSCRLVGDTGRDPGPAESVRDYLFLRTRDELAAIRLQTSTLLLTRELCLRVPWRKVAHDEWDLLLRASVHDDAGLAFVPEPLVVWHSDAGADRLSRKLATWRRSREWFSTVRDLVGPVAYANHLLSMLSIWARDSGDWPAFFGLPWEAVRLGRPTARGLIAHAARWLVPRPLRDRLNRGRSRRPEPPASPP